MTLKLYQQEIDRLYKTPELPNLSPDVLLESKNNDSEALRDALFRVVSNCIWLDGDLTYSADFFELGLDSLQVISLAKQINAYLMQTMPHLQALTTRAIYSRPSIDKLVSMLKSSVEPIPGNRHQKMQKVFDEWSSNLPNAVANNKRPVVILTGSTGSLGSYILEALVSNSYVEKVYCLNRGANGRERQMKSHEQKGLSSVFRSTTFLQCDLSKPFLGLENAIYTGMLHEVTHIIHNAWEVNFNRPLDYFINPHICGVANLIGFCSNSPHDAHFLFVSTESTALGWQEASEEPLPEIIFPDFSSAQDMGYAESKMIAERLVDAASLEFGLRSSVCRVGQIAGPTSETGIWNTREWFPSLIASSIRLGKLPTSLFSLERVDWIPVNAVAQIIVELLFNPNVDPESMELNRSQGSLGSIVEGGGSKAQPFSAKKLQVQHQNSNLNFQDIKRVETFQQTQPYINKEARGLDPAVEVSIGKYPNHDTAFDKKQKIPIQTDSSVTQVSGERTSQARSSRHPNVYHIVNPNPTRWQEIIPTLRKTYADPLELIPFRDWLIALQVQAENDVMAAKAPATRLLRFFEQLEQSTIVSRGVLSTTKAVKASPTMAALGPVEDAWVRMWMRQWGFSRQ